MDEIRQNGKTVLYSEDGRSIPMFFNNLTGKNFSGKEYEDYIRCVALADMGFSPGVIELWADMGFSPGVIELCRNGKTIKQGVIPNVIP